MLDRIEKLVPTLSPAEQRVARWIVSHPHRAPEIALANLAQEAGVSEPTVVRFCRHIGAHGFRDLKVRLAQHLATKPDSVHAQVSLGDEPAAILRKVIGASMREMKRVQDTLSAEQIAQAAALLSTTSRIFFCGVGASAIVAADAQNKFFRLGLPCAAFTDEPSICQAAAISPRGGAIVAISKTGESLAINRAATLAHAAGAKVIALTTPGSSLDGNADIRLMLDVQEDTTAYTPMSSRLAQLAVLDVLQVSTALMMGERARTKLDASKRALHES